MTPRARLIETCVVDNANKAVSTKKVSTGLNFFPTVSDLLIRNSQRENRKAVAWHPINFFKTGIAQSMLLRRREGESYRKERILAGKMREIDDRDKDV